MADKAFLDDYPALATWYREHAQQPPAALPGQLVLRTCEALRRDRATAARLWIDSFTSFLGASSTPLEDFLVAEETIQRCDVELLDLIGDLGEAAVRAGAGDEFYRTMQRGADATGLVALRFLSAWTALNTGHLDACVEECEKVDEPFASVHTIHGQALLELGRPKEALEALEIAVRLAPGELLAWFQKAKSHHVLGQFQEACAALKECQRLAPQSDEVALYMAMVAAEAEAAPLLWQQGWSALRTRLARFSDIPTVSLTLLRLAALLRDKEKAFAVVAETAWPGAELHSDTMQSLALTLRLFGERGWMDVAAQLLTKITPRGEAC